MATATATAKKFAIKTESELEAAIGLKNELAARRAELEAQEKTAVAKLKQEMEASHQIEIDGRTLTIAEREAEILEAAEAYVKKNPEAAKAEGKKSRNYPTGTIGYRKSPASVKRFEKDSWDKAVKKFAKAAIEKLGMLVGMKTLSRNLPNLVTIKIEPNISAIKNERIAEAITDAQLKKLGLEFVPPADVLFIQGAERKTD